jgi:hypothetical protein
VRVAHLVAVLLQSSFGGVQPAHSDVSAPWKVALEDEGITVYKRNRASSPYEEVRAEALLDGTVSQFTPFFSDPTNYKKWVYGALDTQLLESTQPMDFVFRGVFQIPWPFENRELISHVVIAEKSDPATLTATLSHTVTSHKTSPELVRVERFESLWSVVQASERQVRFSIEMYVEPGGKLPPFVVNLVLSRIQLWSIKNLRKQIAER